MKMPTFLAPLSKSGSMALGWKFQCSLTKLDSSLWQADSPSTLQDTQSQTKSSIVEGHSILLHVHNKSQNWQAFSQYKCFDSKEDD